jgi:hypothetical protein
MTLFIERVEMEEFLKPALAGQQKGSSGVEDPFCYKIT